MKSTPLWTRLCKPPSRALRMFTSLDRRVFRRSQVVHGERAQCELHDSGPVRMSTSGRIRVPANSLPRVKRRSKRPGLVCGSTRRGRRAHPVRSQARRGRREHQRRFQVVVVGELGVVGELAVGRSEEETRRPRGDVIPFRACCSWFRFFPEAPRRRGPGATAFCGWGNPTHGAEKCEPPAS